MASQFQIQILKDTTKDATVKLTGNVSDGTLPTSDPGNTTIVVSRLYGALDSNNIVLVGANTPKNNYETTIRSIEYSVAAEAGGAFSLNWRGSNSNGVIANMSSSGNFGMFRDQEGVIKFNGVGIANANSGEIFVDSVGVSNGSYTIIVHLRKSGSTYQQGQFNDPNAFNLNVT